MWRESHVGFYEAAGCDSPPLVDWSSSVRQLATVARAIWVLNPAAHSGSWSGRTPDCRRATTSTCVRISGDSCGRPPS
jgi:hypothetical protein